MKLNASIMRSRDARMRSKFFNLKRENQGFRQSPYSYLVLSRTGHAFALKFCSRRELQGPGFKDELVYVSLENEIAFDFALASRDFAPREWISRPASEFACSKIGLSRGTDGSFGWKLLQTLQNKWQVKTMTWELCIFTYNLLCGYILWNLHLYDVALFALSLIHWPVVFSRQELLVWYLRCIIYI